MPVPFEIETVPTTVGELITATVRKCVEAYNERVRKGEAGITPLTERQIRDMADVGRITFGICNSDREQDVREAVECALSAFRDGLFRLFVNEKEQTAENEAIDLREGDVLTFIRLTMLAGRMW
ncbi:MAG: hypothetical protein J6T47_08565 [Lachnospiraceae bacterium]|nr:hypothetical protein [Lachnospiraceae bacterium]